LNDELRTILRETLLRPDFRRATFAGALRGAMACPWKRIVVRPVVLRGELHLQFSYFDERKDFTHNVRPSEAETCQRIEELADFGFAGIHLATSQEEMDLRISKRGKVQMGRRKRASEAPLPLSHNRVKKVPLPEGQPDGFLRALGVLTPEGKVRSAMRAKFTQINEFLKLVQHVLEEAQLRSLGRPVEILDCGCGSSYLTLAVHHYLNNILNISAHVMGVDVNEEVIRKSSERSARCGATGVRFAVGRIDTTQTRPDLVLALHACDTATDDALALGITTQARAILSVPCCHHHLNEQVRPEGPAAVLRPLLRHGILKQRQADLYTDAFRALILRILGYRAEVIEFISPEATARNLMIRAVRGPTEGDSTFLAEYRALRHFCGATPYLEELLGERLSRWLTQG
jgi:SAM-dependent methyltransferase